MNNIKYNRIIDISVIRFYFFLEKCEVYSENLKKYVMLLYLWLL